MGWTTPVDSYCERTAPGFWAEPLNAVTNLAFLGVALWLWPRVRGDGASRALCVILFVIGLGSGLFHTVAERWAALADVVPILAFILVYLWAVNARVIGLGRRSAVVAALLFLPLAALIARVLGAIAPEIGSSVGYVPVVLVILAYAAALARRAPRFARDLCIGAALLSVSIAARAVDMPLCPRVPEGTHFLWHLINAAMLGWMIASFRRQMLAALRARG
ncbi:ceramidase domain-containing protein [Acidimangrovimonas sediminis]|uniref:ceramidase domain-containing protein n=1 Tax=Acidimangrovimonas sediminis TaxID=2056283 RepID=UPI000C7FB1FD|nr:ceramidase domain-containing protein [Acidimangrovimonas sediminis]